jgi:hypothetical protein
VSFPDEVLMAYADDELDAPTREAVEAAMASDPQIARRIAQHKALHQRVHSVFDKVLEEPVPARLLQAVRADPAGPDRSNVVALRRRPERRWSWPQWAAIAASLIVGVIAGRLALLRVASPGLIATSGGVMSASGALADALSNQLASAQTGADAVRIGVSFRSKSGEYCRTFTLRRPGTLAGLACRAADGWQVAVLAHAQAPGAASGAYRQAASAMPPAVVAAVGDQIAGEPLDARAEAAARARHWRP